MAQIECGKGRSALRFFLAAGVLGLTGLLPATHAHADPSPAEYSATPVPPAQVDAALARLDDIAAAIMRRTQIPGMAVAVVRDGKVAYAKGFGIRKVGEPAKIDPDTVFQLASLSKSLSGTVVARQVGAGMVKWDTPLVSHLPWFQLSDPWVTSHVTVADMFSHRSGLPDHAGDELEDVGFDRQQVLERLRYLPLASFRDTYAYTNFGLTAGAEAVAVASGTDWASLSETALYKPLGMASTSSRFADYEARANRAFPHVKINGTFVSKYQRKPDAQAPAGGASASMNDFARWMVMVLQQGTFEGREIVPANVLLPAIRAEMISSLSRTPESRTGSYGYGFGVSISSSGRVSLDHSGAFSMGAGTTYRLLPSLGIGIAVFTNAEPIGAAEAVAAEFMDQVEIGRTSRDWFAAYSQVMGPLMAPAGSLAGRTAPPNPAPAATAALYAGSYYNPYFGTARVTEKDGALELALGPDGAVRYPLTHWDGNTFAFVPFGENEPAGSKAAATFSLSGQDPAGEITIDYLNTDGLGHFVRQ
ncbi:serine hydrolase [Aquabacter cavernae]|uniref:serine hydrolase n=1 Tax=Aquabacter cavernae TaxID=2496029 RepID=UPI000F8F42D3|nr:serine hydrolase [Aquabacter cavernae]